MAFGRNPLILADSTFSATGATAWNTQIFGVTDAVSGGIPYFSSTTAEATSALLAQYGVITGGGAGAAPYTTSGFTFGGAAAGTGLAVAAGTATTDVNAGLFTQSWNNAAIAFTAFKVIATDTSSTSASLLADFRLSTGSVVRFDKNGSIIVTDQANAYSFRTDSPNPLRADTGGVAIAQTAIQGRNTFNHTWTNTANWFDSADTNLSRTAAGELSVGTGAQGSAAGTMRAAAYKVGATAGASFGPGIVTSITVVNGIVTAIS